MSYFSKIWNRWFGRKSSGSVSSQSTTVSTSSNVDTLNVSTSPSSPQTNSKIRTASRGQSGAGYSGESSASYVDPATVIMVANNYSDPSPAHTEEQRVSSGEPSPYLAPYEAHEQYYHDSSGSSHRNSDNSSHDSSYGHHESKL